VGSSRRGARDGRCHHCRAATRGGWAAYFLIREPEVLPYLDAVCCEARRIEPVVTDLARVRKKALPLGPDTVPAGEMVFVNSCALLRDEALCPEPTRFRPERFLDRKLAPWEFVPFGGGQRRCLSAAFAEAELGIVLATIARTWDLALASDVPESPVRRGITRASNVVLVNAPRSPPQSLARQSRDRSALAVRLSLPSPRCTAPARLCR
jgi:cytochrome P450